MEPQRLHLPENPRRRAVFERAYRTLMRANQVLVTSNNEGELLADMCEVIVDTAGYAMAWVGYGQLDAKRSVTPVARYGASDYLNGLVITWDGDDPNGRGPVGTALRTGEIQIVHDTDTEPSYAPWRDQGRRYGLRSICALPFDVNGSRGCLAIYAGDPDAFDPPALDVFAELAANLRYGVRRIRESARVATSLRATVEALSAAVELRDPYTAGHQRRVAELAAAMCVHLGIGSDDVEGIRLAGILHDIGKLGIPIEILTTIAPLSVVQYAFIKLHPEFGEGILDEIDFAWPVKSWVLQHHERLDGSGYPHGLRGPSILMGSRVIAVADVYESMATDRPYRRTRGHGPALAELRIGAGKIYDPDAVAACAAVMEESDFKFLDGIGRPTVAARPKLMQ